MGRVAIRLRGEFGIPFLSRAPQDIDITVDVDRRRQREAIACHRSQSIDNPVPWRRLELERAQESFRWLPTATVTAGWHFRLWSQAREHVGHASFGQHHRRVALALEESGSDARAEAAGAHNPDRFGVV